MHTQMLTRLCVNMVIKEICLAYVYHVASKVVIVFPWKVMLFVLCFRGSLNHCSQGQSRIFFFYVIFLCADTIYPYMLICGSSDLFSGLCAPICFIMVIKIRLIHLTWQVKIHSLPFLWQRIMPWMNKGIYTHFSIEKFYVRYVRTF